MTEVNMNTAVDLKEKQSFCGEGLKSIAYYCFHVLRHHFIQELIDDFTKLSPRQQGLLQKLAGLGQQCFFSSFLKSMSFEKEMMDLLPELRSMDRYIGLEDTKDSVTVWKIQFNSEAHWVAVQLSSFSLNIEKQNGNLHFTGFPYQLSSET